MTNTTLVSAVTQLYDANNSTSATSLSSVIDLRSAVNSRITIKMVTGTAPTVQCIAKVLWYHTTSGTPPTAASPADGPTGWKTLAQFGSGLVASTTTESNYTPPQGGYLCIEFTQSTTATVSCEAFITTITSASSV